MRVIDDTKWDESAQALICDKKSWYWRGRTKPDLELMQRQHDGFVAIMEREGVEIVWLDCKELNCPKAVFTRDFGVAIPVGVILGRFAPLMRRGEKKTLRKHWVFLVSLFFGQFMGREPLKAAISHLLIHGTQP